ncbi:MAG TPA: hypothetical protein VK638_52095, partial [Edaphobacter sp.]|nr:hypothetical protein [Edaphobacter sp.]
MDDFQLSPKGPTIEDIRKGRELIDNISRRAIRRRRQRPKLEAWSFRIPMDLHNDLRELSKEIDPVAMSEITVGLLEIYLPRMRAAVSKPKQETASPEKQELTAIVTEVVSALLERRGGSSQVGAT